MNKLLHMCIIYRTMLKALLPGVRVTVLTVLSARHLLPLLLLVTPGTEPLKEARGYYLADIACGQALTLALNLTTLRIFDLNYLAY